jgi:hypothetical protein
VAIIYKANKARLRMQSERLLLEGHPTARRSRRPLILFLSKIRNLRINVQRVLELERAMESLQTCRCHGVRQQQTKE